MSCDEHSGSMLSERPAGVIPAPEVRPGTFVGNATALQATDLGAFSTKTGTTASSRAASMARSTFKR
jgi:hypothetical protein